ncbi:MAG: FAD/NAD(P)-binding protein [bacterium]
MVNPKSSNRPEPLCGSDTWFPLPARIVHNRTENFNTTTLSLELVDEQTRQLYRWAPGQFNMLYLPGLGEAAISVSSDAERPERLEHTIRTVGSVTRSICDLQPGGIVGLRGPFGNGWPLAELEGRNVLLVAGGIGLAPLRPVVYWLLRHRDRYKRVVLLFGCRTPEDRVYTAELEQWARDEIIDVLVTVDNSTSGWAGPVGVVTNLLRRVKVHAEQTIVLICGPRILNRVAAWNFLQSHVAQNQIYVSLERNMNCGFGRCGHCQYGGKFVCTDGPVFRFDEIADCFGKEEI